MKKIGLITLLGIFTLMSCTTSQMGKGGTYGAAGGAAAGAILGQIIGGDTEATLLGAAAGAVLGGAVGAGVGRMMDKQAAEMQQALATSNAAALQREGDLIAITLKGDVIFDHDSDAVRPGIYNELDRIAQIMIRYPNTSILVGGHTDSTGSASYNQLLSERRANHVRDQLINRGVPSSRITGMGYGATLPVATNDTAEGRQMNRRVEIRINPNSQG
ncbi:OmpA family protein [Desulfosarcina sp. OttesenSCG-928-A07]|nr:OmpA family protein [Desulfosarcina sp. OttesenSCG-928-G17]MDL2330066.1 OmpA family protein [Desulfosarcina sp. OttesenSCG-928-A07]